MSKPRTRQAVDPDRRRFIGAMSFAGLAGVSGFPPPLAAVNEVGGRVERPETSEAPNVTSRLASYVMSGTYDELPAAVCKEARRTFLNWVGCALGGSRHETVDAAIAALAPFSGPARASILGRAERMDLLHASLMNGISSHVLDFDDTHLRTIIHPAGPVVPALLAIAEDRVISGKTLLNAMVLGIEVECRIGNAVCPAHYDAGWHSTGTMGVFGSAAASGKLLGLTTEQMVWALGLAATQPVGLREMFGSMTKSFHPGRSAQNGLTAALLASKNFTSATVGIEGKSGWANVLSTTRNYAEITERLGSSYEISANTYKPFACGVVIHPALDACIQLRNEHTLTADQIERIELRANPLVLELTGKKTPQTGLETKFSIYFAAAIAIIKGSAGARDFSDENARNPAIAALRDRVTVVIDPSITQEQVRASVTLKDGRTLVKSIEHVVGSVQRPMTDTELEAKFLQQAEGVLPASRARMVMDMCWNIDRLSSAGELAKAAASA